MSAPEIYVNGRYRFTPMVPPSGRTGSECVAAERLSDGFDWMVRFVEDNSLMPVLAAELSVPCAERRVLAPETPRQQT